MREGGYKIFWTSNRKQFGPFFWANAQAPGSGGDPEPGAIRPLMRNRNLEARTGLGFG